MYHTVHTPREAAPTYAIVYLRAGKRWRGQSYWAATADAAHALAGQLNAALAQRGVSGQYVVQVVPPAQYGL